MRKSSTILTSTSTGVPPSPAGVEAPLPDGAARFCVKTTRVERALHADRRRHAVAVDDDFEHHGALNLPLHGVGGVVRTHLRSQCRRRHTIPRKKRTVSESSAVAGSESRTSTSSDTRSFSLSHTVARSWTLRKRQGGRRFGHADPVHGARCQRHGVQHDHLRWLGDIRGCGAGDNRTCDRQRQAIASDALRTRRWRGLTIAATATTPAGTGHLKEHDPRNLEPIRARWFRSGDGFHLCHADGQPHQHCTSRTVKGDRCDDAPADPEGTFGQPG